MHNVRTRIAPSPTGYLHIGTARTALFNYLFAKKHGGKFIIRIEDTDLERSEKKFEAEILESLAWLGIAADEGPREGGPAAPYRQSERLSSYTPYLERLLKEGRAFRCPHSEANLAVERELLMKRGQPPIHRCEHRDRTIPAENTVIRFKTEPNETLSFADIIRGEITFSSELLGDFAIAKDLETPLYNFAVVIDDYEMKISHVIRGEDHISNTPKQILIQQALGLPTPIYAHLPLILGPDRSKLSKRHGATSIREFREQGYLPEALINFMALLGWNPGGERELFSLAELAREFDLAKVQKAGAVFDIEKLGWVNAEYIRKKSPRELAELLLAPGSYNDIALKLARLGVGDPGELYDKQYLEKVIAIEQPRLRNLAEIPEHTYYFSIPHEYDALLLAWKKMTLSGVRDSLNRAKAIIENAPDENFDQRGLEERFFKEIGRGDKGELLWPLRVALTGERASPGPFELMELFGKTRTCACIAAALHKVLQKEVG